ncbi:spore germination protein [Bacillus sp. 2205SS5-2]|uniref:spore germination protein n=1 Tax=Bacillus sp. 2205SS5-2 TaxID=3109031 RepID=UPI0030043B43
MKLIIRKKKNSKKKQDTELLPHLSLSADYKGIEYCSDNGEKFSFHYIFTLVDQEIVRKSILPYLLKNSLENPNDLHDLIPVTGIKVLTDKSLIDNHLLRGSILVTFASHPDSFVLIPARKVEGRSLSSPEVEFTVEGPKEAFAESIIQNINLLRKRIPQKELIIEEIVVGTVSQTKVGLIYIDNITNDQNVETVRQRITDLDIDQVIDSTIIGQLISDNSFSPFPQILDTERPDRAASVLVEGKIVILVDGSPHALISPTTLVEFFSAFEDYFSNWIIASFIRLVRLFAVAFSILITPIYVAALTYHYELIPKDLMSTLITSRQEIPLPPILEALFLELTIELLREAGARLPTKVGQTIGIVGGIVIGTASVEAGLTSNVLLILVALGALASFSTPVYQMGNTIRLLRFPFLLFAELWGLIGIVYCFCLLMTHLLRLTSLGRPFLEPLFPPRIQDLRDSIIRFPFSLQNRRPEYLRTKKPQRFAKPQHSKQKADIDE